MATVSSKRASTAATDNLTREWQASIDLGFAPRAGKTRLVTSQHLGPLRVQRPFYPEHADCCHVYLLHPPGGMVIGDQLQINATLEGQSAVLITTPSAGKIYGAGKSKQTQSQIIHFTVAADACLEWLPQETIVFNGARGRLQSRIHLEEGALYAGWDIVRLGRSASGERFEQGECIQSLELWQNGEPLFIERNRIYAESPLPQAVWGLQGKNTFGTFILTVELDRNLIDELVTGLEALESDSCNLWGISQKNQLLIVRFLGDDVALCRHGFEYLWQRVRPHFNGKPAVKPRIWNT